jgi:hypothetical protein
MCLVGYTELTENGAANADACLVIYLFSNSGHFSSNFQSACPRMKAQVSPEKVRVITLIDLGLVLQLF